MRILHVVTLISPDGAFGGPVRVALNLARAAAMSGDEAVVAAATRGWDDVPTRLDGVRLRLFPAKSIPAFGLAGLYSPRLLRWVIANAREFDVVHVHFTRDLVTIPAAAAARARRVPLVLQTHGMVDPSSRPAARMLDALIVRRLLLKASRVLDLTDDERTGLRAVVRGRAIRSTRLINGTFLHERRTRVDLDRAPSVLFLSRLHPRKRPTAFVEMAVRVHSRVPDALFALVGPDEGEATRVLDLIDQLGATDYIRYEGAVDPTASASRMSEADLLVLPSIDEIFPMVVLEALGTGVPVVVGGSAAMAAAVQEAGAGAIPVSDDPSDYADAVSSLLASPAGRAKASEQARTLAEREFSIQVVARTLREVYEQVLDELRPNPK